MSIERRLTIGLLAGLGAGLMAVGVGIYFSARSAFIDQADAKLRTEAMVMVMFVRQEPSGIRMFFNDTLLKQYGAEAPTAFYMAWRPDGSVLKRSVSLRRASLPKRTARVEQPVYFDLELPGGAPGRAIGVDFVPWIENRHLPFRDPHSRVALVVATDVRPFLKELDRLRWKLLAGGLAIWVALIPLVHLLLKSALRPLLHVGARAEGIHPHNLSERFPVETLPRELQPICFRLNDLLARIEESFRREREFSSSLAHELRTPIAELKSLAQLGMTWDGSPDPRLYADLEQIADQMERITTHLLTLSRCEQGKIRVRRENLALAELVRSAWRPFEQRARMRRQQLEVDVPSGWCVLTDRALLQGMLTNLLSNAVDYAPAGAIIGVRASFGDNGTLWLEIRNSAPDLQPADLPHMFLRLWRKDGARSSGSGHCGLGLALVRAYADLLGIALATELDPAQVFSIRLEFQRAAAPQPCEQTLTNPPVVTEPDTRRPRPSPRSVCRHASRR